MFLQNNYQSRRQYARVATGKASPIDVAASETLVEKLGAGALFNLLIPILFLIYLCELVVGSLCLISLWSLGRFYWQVGICIVSSCV